MSKVLGAVLVGVVIGAAVSEIIKRQKPDLYKNVGEKIKKGMGALKDAFTEGYKQASAPSEEAESAPES